MVLLLFAAFSSSAKISKRCQARSYRLYPARIALRYSRQHFVYLEKFICLQLPATSPATKILLAMNSTSSQPSKAKALGTHSNGILPIPASATQQRAAPSLIKPSNRVSTSRLKVVARNLPPSLTLAEFEAILGEEWKVNRGKVDWFSFKPGKLSKKYEDPLKLFWTAFD